MDLDGKCAAAIAYKYYYHDDYLRALQEGREQESIECIGVNYNIPFPFNKITPQEAVIIVDYSLQKDGEFDALFRLTDNIIWIDHHKSALERFAYLEDKLVGLRSVEKAGCELAWDYFYPDRKTPRVVELLGDYDTWKFKYGDDSKYLQLGIRLHNTKPSSENWLVWLGDSFNPDNMVKDGKLVDTFRNNYNKSLMAGLGFYTEFEGHRGIACNQGSTSSQLFDSINENTYDLMLPFSFDGNQWTVSIYSKRPDIDCSEIAKKYGGGGHKGAAGFQCASLPFVRIRGIYEK